MRKSAFEPCIPTRGTTVPTGNDWIHEIKHDGYRLIVQRDGQRVRLFTRNGHDWSGRFPLITEAALRNRNALRLRRPDERGRRSQAVAAAPAEEPSRQDAAAARGRHHPQRLTGRDRFGPVPACLPDGP